MPEVLTFDKRAAGVKTEIKANKGRMPLAKDEAGKKKREDLRLTLGNDVYEMVRLLDSYRQGSTGGPNGNRKPVDVSLGQFVKDKYGFAPSENGSPDAFYRAMGVDPSEHSMESLYTFPDFNPNFRWLVPEVIREAIRLGLRKKPIWPNIIAAEETVDSLAVRQPIIMMSDATPKKLNELENIPTGYTTFDQKIVNLFKVGTGMKISDEVRQFVKLNMLALYLQDVGIKLSQALDTLAITTLINGEQTDGSESAPVIGVADTSPGIAYEDILGVWIRGGRLGRQADTMIAGEGIAKTVLTLPEFKGFAGDRRLQSVALKTPLPQAQDIYIHGAMPANQLMLLDSTSALLKLNCAALRMENERIAEKQQPATYITLQTGFAIVFRDGRVFINGTELYSDYPFPSWMDVDAAQVVTFG